MSDRLARLANACLLPGFAGLEPPDWLRRELDGGLGGVVLFGRNVRDRDQLTALCAALGADSCPLIAIDEEGGDVTRVEVRSGSSIPGNLALGAVDDVGLTERVAGALGAQLHAVGITHDLAPVADVNTNPLNPVIGVRSFGSDADHVSRHVAAFVRGLQEQGVAACAKHFPGHGATEVDSHLGLPTVDTSLADLLRLELAPFRAAIEAGARAIMTAHIVVPAIDDVPATLSHAQLTGLLREQLGFTGLIITDALEMRAVSATVGMEGGAVQALAAGADALCLGHDIEAAHVQRVRDAIVDAVYSRRLDEQRLAEAAGRVGASHVEAASGGAAPSLAEIGAEAARRALQVEGDPAPGGPLLVLDLVPTPSIAAGPASHTLASVLHDLGADVEGKVVEGPDADIAALISAQPDRRPVVVVRDARLHAWERAAVVAALASRPDTVIVDAGYPGWRPETPGATLLTTFGTGRANFVAAAELLTTRR